MTNGEQTTRDDANYEKENSNSSEDDGPSDNRIPASGVEHNSGRDVVSNGKDRSKAKSHNTRRDYYRKKKSMRKKRINEDLQDSQKASWSELHSDVPRSRKITYIPQKSNRNSECSDDVDVSSSSGLDLSGCHATDNVLEEFCALNDELDGGSESKANGECDNDEVTRQKSTATVQIRSKEVPDSLRYDSPRLSLVGASPQRTVLRNSAEIADEVNTHPMEQLQMRKTRPHQWQKKSPKSERKKILASPGRPRNSLSSMVRNRPRKISAPASPQKRPTLRRSASGSQERPCVSERSLKINTRHSVASSTRSLDGVDESGRTMRSSFRSRSRSRSRRSTSNSCNERDDEEDLDRRSDHSNEKKRGQRDSSRISADTRGENSRKIMDDRSRSRSRGPSDQRGENGCVEINCRPGSLQKDKTGSQRSMKGRSRSRSRTPTDCDEWGQLKESIGSKSFDETESKGSQLGATKRHSDRQESKMASRQSSSTPSVSSTCSKSKSRAYSVDSLSSGKSSDVESCRSLDLQRQSEDIESAQRSFRCRSRSRGKRISGEKQSSDQSMSSLSSRSLQTKSERRRARRSTQTSDYKRSTSLSSIGSISSTSLGKYGLVDLQGGTSAGKKGCTSVSRQHKNTKNSQLRAFDGATIDSANSSVEVAATVMTSAVIFGLEEDMSGRGNLRERENALTRHRSGRKRRSRDGNTSDSSLDLNDLVGSNHSVKTEQSARSKRSPSAALRKRPSKRDTIRKEKTSKSQGVDLSKSHDLSSDSDAHNNSSSSLNIDDVFAGDSDSSSQIAGRAGLETAVDDCKKTEKKQSMFEERPEAYATRKTEGEITEFLLAKPAQATFDTSQATYESTEKVSHKTDFGSKQQKEEGPAGEDNFDPIRPRHGSFSSERPIRRQLRRQSSTKSSRRSVIEDALDAQVNKSAEKNESYADTDCNTPRSGRIFLKRSSLGNNSFRTSTSRTASSSSTDLSSKSGLWKAHQTTPVRRNTGSNKNSPRQPDRNSLSAAIEKNIDDTERGSEHTTKTSHTAGFRVHPVQPSESNNISMWEIRKRFKRDFPDDPVPSDVVLRQLYRSEAIGQWEMRERYQEQFPDEPLPPDHIIERYFDERSAASTETLLVDSLPTSGVSIGPNKPKGAKIPEANDSQSSFGSNSSALDMFIQNTSNHDLAPGEKTGILNGGTREGAHSPMTFATDPTWEKYGNIGKRQKDNDVESDRKSEKAKLDGSALNVQWMQKMKTANELVPSPHTWASRRAEHAKLRRSISAKAQLSIASDHLSNSTGSLDPSFFSDFSNDPLRSTFHESIQCLETSTSKNIETDTRTWDNSFHESFSSIDILEASPEDGDEHKPQCGTKPESSISNENGLAMTDYVVAEPRERSPKPSKCINHQNAILSSVNTGSPMSIADIRPKGNKFGITKLKGPKSDTVMKKTRRRSNSASRKKSDSAVADPNDSLRRVKCFPSNASCDGSANAVANTVTNRSDGHRSRFRHSFGTHQSRSNQDCRSTLGWDVPSTLLQNNGTLAEIVVGASDRLSPLTAGSQKPAISSFKARRLARRLKQR